MFQLINIAEIQHSKELRRTVRGIEKVIMKDLLMPLEGTIKRGDFLIRKPCMCEVEVKCFTLYEKNTARPYYYLPYSQAKSHARMEEVVNNNVLLAIYERDKDQALQKTLGMLEIKKLLKQKNGIIYKETNDGPCLLIPRDIMTPGLALLQNGSVETT